MKQENFKIIKLCGSKVPLITVDEDEYLPIRYVFEHVLLKTYPNIHKKEEYKDKILKLDIDYSYNNGGKQQSYCINKNGWKLILGKMKFSRFTDWQINRYYEFCKYIGLDYNHEVVKTTKLHEYDMDCIKEFEKNNKNFEYFKCNKCKNDLPKHVDFVPLRKDRTFDTLCYNCQKNDKMIRHSNDILYRIAFLYGKEAYSIYKKDIVKFYDIYVKNDENPITFDYIGKKGYIKIVKSLIEKGELDPTSKDFTFENIKNKINTGKIHNLKFNDVYIECTNGDCLVRRWKYHYPPSLKLTKEKAKTIFLLYCKENGLSENDLLEINSITEILKNCKIEKYVTKSYNGFLEFLVECLNRNFAGYKFRVSSKKYYTNKENCIFDMKYLIEKDMKLQVEKAPLYITKYALHKKCSSLYNCLCNGGYYNSLFEWINDCYPNKFIESDFDINPYRAKFDSLEESIIDQYLRDRFGKTVLYNQRDSQCYINIEGMIPDWLIHTNKGCYLVEYFGLYTESESSLRSSSRLKAYSLKIKTKLEKYEKLKEVGYNSLFIYPNDIKNNFYLLESKIENMNI